MIDYCKRYPGHVKAMFDSRNMDYRTIPLAGAIGNSTILPTMSTYLPDVIVSTAPYFNINTEEPVLLTFVCGKDLSICSILDIPTPMSMRPATVEWTSPPS